MDMDINMTGGMIGITDNAFCHPWKGFKKVFVIVPSQEFK